MAEKLVIHGGRPLRGEVHISGAKNSVLKLMAASLLSPEEIHLHNVPQLTDVNVMTEVIRELGADITQDGNKMVIHAADISNVKAPYELVRKMRASFNVLGALLGRFGEAKVALPGGCSIGKRGIDLHVKGLELLGADVKIAHGYVTAKATQLTGAHILLDTPSVGATENIMLAAVYAEGATVIENAAQEPEIVDLVNFLNAMGADISGAGTAEIVINGVPKESLHSTQYAVMPDRVEAATYLIAAAGTKGDVIVQNVLPVHLHSLTHKLVEMGAEIETPSPNSLHISIKDKLSAMNVVTQPYPGFPTDLQAPFTALAAVCDGVSVIKETIYENRFKHVGELKRMNADIQMEENVAVVTGVPHLSGAEVTASDLRAAAALIIAGLQAKGYTSIFDLHHLDRGYEKVVEKLTGLGAHVQRKPVERDESGLPVEAE